MKNLSFFTRKILSCDNFNLVRVGDGEIQCMVGVKGHNCDFQSYSPKLQKALKESLSSLGKIDNTFFSRWKLDGPEQAVISSLEEELGIKCTEDHDLLMHRVGEITSDHYELWKTIKESPRRKVFVGPDRLSGVMHFLNVDVMTVVPQHEAFDRPFDPEALDNDIWLFSAGLAAKVWIGEVVKKNPNVTCIDTGSAFDPIFVGGTRTNQLSQSYLKEFYKDLLN